MTSSVQVAMKEAVLKASRQEGNLYLPKHGLSNRERIEIALKNGIRDESFSNIGAFVRPLQAIVVSPAVAAQKSVTPPVPSGEEASSSLALDLSMHYGTHGSLAQEMVGGESATRAAGEADREKSKKIEKPRRITSRGTSRRTSWFLL